MLIVNPFSGKGISKSTLGTIVSVLCAGERSVTVYTAGQYTPEELTYDNAKYHECVVCVGGDGTLSAVISGLLRSGVSIPVGYIPTGTANDVAATLALSRNPVTAARAIINGVARPHDAGIFAGRYFTYIAAFGAFTGASYKTSRRAKRSLGRLAYILGSIAAFSSIKSRHVIVEYADGIIEGNFIFGCVANSTSVAGLVKIDPERVDLADGMFEIFLVKRPSGFRDFLTTISHVLKKNYNGDNVLLVRAAKAKFSFDEPVSWTLDGENGGLHEEVEIENLREAISIIL